jgi:hypothetical protein
LLGRARGRKRQQSISLLPLEARLGDRSAVNSLGHQRWLFTILHGVDGLLTAIHALPGFSLFSQPDFLEYRIVRTKGSSKLPRRMIQR